MVDLETMSQQKNASILSIGAITFPSTLEVHPKPFRVNISIKDCVAHGLHVSKDTVEWWSNIDPIILKKSTVGAVSLNEALEGFTKWVYEIKVINKFDRVSIWGNGASFDLGILSNAYHSLNKELPWNTWEEYCYRTITHLYGLTPQKLKAEYLESDEYKSRGLLVDTAEFHDPVEDCRFQAWALESTLNALFS